MGQSFSSVDLPNLSLGLISSSDLWGNMFSAEFDQTIDGLKGLNPAASTSSSSGIPGLATSSAAVTTKSSNNKINKRHSMGSIPTSSSGKKSAQKGNNTIIAGFPMASASASSYYNSAVLNAKKKSTSSTTTTSTTTTQHKSKTSPLKAVEMQEIIPHIPAHSITSLRKRSHLSKPNSGSKTNKSRSPTVDFLTSYRTNNNYDDYKSGPKRMSFNNSPLSPSITKSNTRRSKGLIIKQYNDEKLTHPLQKNLTEMNSGIGSNVPTIPASKGDKVFRKFLNMFTTKTSKTVIKRTANPALNVSDINGGAGMSNNVSSLMNAVAMLSPHTTPQNNKTMSRLPIPSSSKRAVPTTSITDVFATPTHAFEGTSPERIAASPFAKLMLESPGEKRCFSSVKSTVVCHACQAQGCCNHALPGVSAPATASIIPLESLSESVAPTPSIEINECVISSSAPAPPTLSPLSSSSVPDAPPMAPPLAPSLSFQTAPQSATKNITAKRFHWQPISANDLQDTIFGEIQSNNELGNLLEQFHINEGEIESSFIKKKINTGEENKNEIKEEDLMMKAPRIHLIDLKRSYNVDIVLARFRISHNDIIKAINELNMNILTEENVHSLIKCVPTLEEKQLIQEWLIKQKKINESINDLELITQLASCDQFLYLLSNVSSCLLKLQCMLIQYNYRSVIDRCNLWLSIIEECCKEIRSSIHLRTIFVLILKLGNLLNKQSQLSSNAVSGFKLSTLNKLRYTKSNDNSFTLLHYLIRYLIVNHPIALQLPSSLQHVNEASKIEQNMVIQEINQLQIQMKQSEQLIQTWKQEVKVDYMINFELFSNDCKLLLSNLENRYKVVSIITNEIAKYFAETDRDSSTATWDSLFISLHEFITSFIQAKLEVEEEDEKKLKEEKRIAHKEEMKKKMGERRESIHPNNHIEEENEEGNENDQWNEEKDLFADELSTSRIDDWDELDSDENRSSSRTVSQSRRRHTLGGLMGGVSVSARSTTVTNRSRPSATSRNVLGISQRGNQIQSSSKNLSSPAAPAVRKAIATIAKSPGSINVLNRSPAAVLTTKNLNGLKMSLETSNKNNNGIKLKMQDSQLTEIKGGGGKENQGEMVLATFDPLR